MPDRCGGDGFAPLTLLIRVTLGSVWLTEITTDPDSDLMVASYNRAVRSRYIPLSNCCYLRRGFPLVMLSSNSL